MSLTVPTNRDKDVDHRVRDVDWFVERGAVHIEANPIDIGFGVIEVLHDADPTGHSDQNYR